MVNPIYFGESEPFVVPKAPQPGLLLLLLLLLLLYYYYIIIIIIIIVIIIFSSPLLGFSLPLPLFHFH